MTEPAKGPYLIRYYMGRPRMYTLTIDLDDYSKDIANIQGLRGGEEDLATAQLLAAAWELREKSRNIFKRYRGELPTPYGHDCQWCGLCCQRAVEEFLAALAKADGKEKL